MSPSKVAANNKKNAIREQKEAAQKAKLEEKKAIRERKEAAEKAELEEKKAIRERKEAVKNAKVGNKLEDMEMNQKKMEEKTIDRSEDSPHNWKDMFSKSFNLKTSYYVIIAAISLFSLGFYSLIGTDMEASNSAKILSLSAILFSFGILLFSMYLMVKGVEDKAENEWVRIAMILGGVYILDKFVELYEPVSLFIEIINIAASFI